MAKTASSKKGRSVKGRPLRSDSVPKGMPSIALGKVSRGAKLKVLAKRASLKGSKSAALKTKPKKEASSPADTEDADTASVTSARLRRSIADVQPSAAKLPADVEDGKSPRRQKPRGSADRSDSPATTTRLSRSSSSSSLSPKPLGNKKSPLVKSKVQKKVQVTVPASQGIAKYFTVPKPGSNIKPSSGRKGPVLSSKKESEASVKNELSCPKRTVSSSPESVLPPSKLLKEDSNLLSEEVLASSKPKVSASVVVKHEKKKVDSGADEVPGGGGDDEDAEEEDDDDSCNPDRRGDEPLQDNSIEDNLSEGNDQKFCEQDDLEDDVEMRDVKQLSSNSKSSDISEDANIQKLTKKNVSHLNSLEGEKRKSLRSASPASQKSVKSSSEQKKSTKGKPVSNLRYLTRSDNAVRVLRNGKRSKAKNISMFEGIIAESSKRKKGPLTLLKDEDDRIEDSRSDFSDEQSSIFSESDSSSFIDSPLKYKSNELDEKLDMEENSVSNDGYEMSGNQTSVVSLASKSEKSKGKRPFSDTESLEDVKEKSVTGVSISQTSSASSLCTPLSPVSLIENNIPSKKLTDTNSNFCASNTIQVKENRKPDTNKSVDNMLNDIHTDWDTDGEDNKEEKDTARSNPAATKLPREARDGRSSFDELLLSTPIPMAKENEVLKQKGSSVKPQIPVVKCSPVNEEEMAKAGSKIDKSEKNDKSSKEDFVNVASEAASAQRSSKKIPEPIVIKPVEKNGFAESVDYVAKKTTKIDFELLRRRTKRSMSLNMDPNEKVSQNHRILTVEPSKLQGVRELFWTVKAVREPILPRAPKSIEKGSQKTSESTQMKNSSMGLKAQEQKDVSYVNTLDSSAPGPQSTAETTKLGLVSERKNVSSSTKDMPPSDSSAKDVAPLTPVADEQPDSVSVEGRTRTASSSSQESPSLRSVKSDSELLSSKSSSCSATTSLVSAVAPSATAALMPAVILSPKKSTNVTPVDSTLATTVKTPVKECVDSDPFVPSAPLDEDLTTGVAKQDRCVTPTPTETAAKSLEVTPSKYPLDDDLDESFHLRWVVTPTKEGSEAPLKEECEVVVPSPIQAAPCTDEPSQLETAEQFQETHIAGEDVDLNQVTKEGATSDSPTSPPSVQIEHISEVTGKSCSSDAAKNNAVTVDEAVEFSATSSSTPRDTDSCVENENSGSEISSNALGDSEIPSGSKNFTRLQPSNEDPTKDVTKDKQEPIPEELTMAVTVPGNSDVRTKLSTGTDDINSKKCKNDFDQTKLVSGSIEEPCSQDSVEECSSEANQVHVSEAGGAVQTATEKLPTEIASTMEEDHKPESEKETLNRVCEDTEKVLEETNPSHEIRDQSSALSSGDIQVVHTVSSNTDKGSNIQNREALATEEKCELSPEPVKDVNEEEFSILGNGKEDGSSEQVGKLDGEVYIRTGSESIGKDNVKINDSDQYVHVVLGDANHVVEKDCSLSSENVVSAISVAEEVKDLSVSVQAPIGPPLLSPRLEADVERLHLNLNIGNIEQKRREITEEEQSPEKRAIKEQVLSSLGLQSKWSVAAAAAAAAATSSSRHGKRRSQDGVTPSSGRLKTVIKVPKENQRDRKNDRKPLRMVFKNGKPYPGGVEDIPAEVRETEADYPVRSEGNGISDVSSSPSILNGPDYGPTSGIVLADNPALMSVPESEGKGKPDANLVIPEKSSSFSIHPGRLCSDVCSYCFGKFGSLDTPCHVAQLKSRERQMKIMAVETHLALDSCLCDACIRYVDRKANCPIAKPQTVPRKESKSRFEGSMSTCSVTGCAQPARHSLRKKWYIKIRKSVLKKCPIDLDLAHQHLPLPLCAEHFSYMEYFMVCGLCKRRLSRSHMYNLTNTREINICLEADGIPARLSDKLFVCKLCRYYATLRVKHPRGQFTLSANQREFFNSYRKRILRNHDIEVSESEDGETRSESPNDHPPLEEASDGTPTASTSAAAPESATTEDNLPKGKRRRAKSNPVPPDEQESVEQPKKKPRTCVEQAGKLKEKERNEKDRSGSRAGSRERDSSATSEQLEHGSSTHATHSKSTGKNSKSKSNKSGEMDSAAMEWVRKGFPPFYPSENELALHAKFQFQFDDVPSDGRDWEKCTSSLQFDKETKRLWQELQRPYGSQSSFLRHLVLMERYWRQGELVLASDASARATSYTRSVQNRLKAYGATFTAKTPVEPPHPSTKVAVATATSTATTVVASATSLPPSVPVQPSLSILLPQPSAQVTPTRDAGTVLTAAAAAAAVAAVHTNSSPQPATSTVVSHSGVGMSQSVLPVPTVTISTKPKPQTVSKPQAPQAKSQAAVAKSQTAPAKPQVAQGKPQSAQSAHLPQSKQPSAQHKQLTAPPKPQAILKPHSVQTASNQKPATPKPAVSTAPQVKVSAAMWEPMPHSSSSRSPFIPMSAPVVNLTRSISLTAVPPSPTTVPDLHPINSEAVTITRPTRSPSLSNSSQLSLSSSRASSSGFVSILPATSLPRISSQSVNVPASITPIYTSQTNSSSTLTSSAPITMTSSANSTVSLPCPSGIRLETKAGNANQGRVHVTAGGKSFNLTIAQFRKLQALRQQRQDQQRKMRRLASKPMKDRRLSGTTITPILSSKSNDLEVVDVSEADNETNPSFVPMICDVRSGDQAKAMWDEDSRMDVQDDRSMVEITPIMNTKSQLSVEILPKIPRALTVTQISGDAPVPTSLALSSNSSSVTITRQSCESPASKPLQGKKI